MDEINYIEKANEMIEKFPDTSGQIECPKCKSELTYVKIKKNGYTWGQCKSDDCLSWIE
jgi:hypothetical protein